MKVNFENVYEHIGYLFYGLAAEFRNVSSDEDDKLNALIDQHWESTNAREAWLQTHLIQHLHNGINKAWATSLDANQAFNIFENYYLMHKMSFGEPLREKIRQCCNLVAREFYRLQHDSVLIRQAERLLELKKTMS